MSRLASTTDIYKLLGIQPGGLSETEAQSRLQQHGPNELESVAKFRLLSMILSQFSNMFLILLLFASLVSWMTGAGSDALIIAAIVFVNATISFIQEYKAEQSLKALQNMMADLTHVIRDGAIKRIPARLVVPGDVVQIETGDRIPADGIILECVNGMVNESSLTGESVPVMKKAAASASQINDEEKAFAGTTLSYGRLTMLISQTGMGTRIGSIAKVTTEVGTEKSPLQLELDAIGHRIARIAAGICLVVFLIMAIRYDLTLTSIKDSFLFAIALAVAIVPEGLPATVTIGLAFGMRKMARENAIIRKLSAVETLGCTTVICTDKTGTLTKNEMTVRAVHTGGEYLTVSGAGYTPEGDYTTEAGQVIESPGESLSHTLRLAALCNNAHCTAHTAVGDPTEIALLVAAMKADFDLDSLRRQFPRLD
ncbi:MAG: cation-translocating P-type ATPase, partial [Solirubrobacterales bacterium]